MYAIKWRNPSPETRRVRNIMSYSSTFSTIIKLGPIRITSYFRWLWRGTYSCIHCPNHLFYSLLCMPSSAPLSSSKTILYQVKHIQIIIYNITLYFVLLQYLQKPGFNIHAHRYLFSWIRSIQTQSNLSFDFATFLPRSILFFRRIFYLSADVICLYKSIKSGKLLNVCTKCAFRRNIIYDQ